MCKERRQKEIHFQDIFFLKCFVSSRKSATFALAIGKASQISRINKACLEAWCRSESGNNAEIAQLVEHNLAKVGVASSSLVFRSL